METPDQHDSATTTRLGDAEADGERGADDGADQRDAHPVGAVGQDGDGERAGQRGRAGDGDDQQDAGVGEVEGVADVRREHVEGALGGLVEQLDREQHPEGEQRGARRRAWPGGSRRQRRLDRAGDARRGGPAGAGPARSSAQSRRS